MYILLVCFLITSLIFIVLGKNCIVYLDKVNLNNYNLFDNFFIGMCFTGAILNLWSIFLPTNIFSLLVLIFATLLLIYKDKDYYKKTPKRFLSFLSKDKIVSILLISTIFIVLLYAVVTPRLYDSYLYHINAIQWNEFYRTVPGLANFHDRFGLNSSVFVLSACFSFTAIYNQYIFIINSLCFLVFFIWLLKQVFAHKGTVGVFSLVFIYYFIEQYALDISSPGSDLLPNILVGFVLLSVLFEKSAITKKPLLYIFIPLFCITLKLSTLPIILITVFSLFFKNNNHVFSTLKQVMFYSLFLILPWLVRNVILSGYILFPMSGLDLFSFEWKVPAEKAIEIKKWIYSWAKIPFKDCNEVLKMSLQEWAPIWWKNLLEKNQRFFILAVLSPLTYCALWFLNRKIKNYSVYLVFVIAYISLTLWFFAAPDFRFSFSIILLLALSPLLLLEKVLNKFTNIFNPLLYIATVYVLYSAGNEGYKLFKEDYSMKRIAEFAYLPKDVSEVKEKKNVKFKNFIFTTKLGKQIELFAPSQSHSQCYDKFPCSWYLSNDFELRGENLQDGFIFVNK